MYLEHHSCNLVSFQTDTRNYILQGSSHSSVQSTPQSISFANVGAVQILHRNYHIGTGYVALRAPHMVCDFRVCYHEMLAFDWSV